MLVRPSETATFPENQHWHSRCLFLGSLDLSGIFLEEPGMIEKERIQYPISLDDRLRELEASLISWALAQSGGNKSKAAELLQIKRSTLGDRINRCGLGRTNHVAPDGAAPPAAAPQSSSAL
jgi:transcriptional regulator with GAF, ATPase, and Fis domain